MELIKANNLPVLGAGEDLTNDDLLIGRIAVQQALSDFVKNDTFKSGDIVNMLTGAKVGDKKSSLEFIAIKSIKYWIEKDGDNFIGRYPATGPNEKQWNEGTIKRIYHHSFYVLLPQEIKSGMCMPLELPFRSSDIKTAKKLSTFIKMMNMEDKCSWVRCFDLSSVLRQKDKHSWYGSDIKPGRATTELEQQVCERWYRVISASAKIEHQVVEEETAIVNENLEF